MIGKTVAHCTISENINTCPDARGLSRRILESRLAGLKVCSPSSSCEVSVESRINGSFLGRF
jgi:hypothetical protein